MLQKLVQNDLDSIKERDKDWEYNEGQQPRPTFSDMQKEPLPIESKQSTKSITTPRRRKG